jgi:hypothetical protein
MLKHPIIIIKETKSQTCGKQPNTLYVATFLTISSPSRDQIAAHILPRT